MDRYLNKTEFDLKVAIIGAGVVGQSTSLTIDGTSLFHDPTMGYTADYLSADLVFLCVPPYALEDYLTELQTHPYVYIRTTVNPDLIKDTQFAVYPEFLSENTWAEDAVDPPALILGGNPLQLLHLNSVSKFDWLDPNVCSTTPEHAALMKMSSNAFFATKITFMNTLFALCQEMDLEYTELARVLSYDRRVGRQHMDVPGPDDYFGFGGGGLPTCTQELRSLLVSQGVPADLLTTTLHLNESYRNG